MSLKAFHLFFILVSILFCGAMSVWAFKTGASEGLGWGAAVSSIALTLYGVRFVRSSRTIIV
ncbi:MAG: hypothetical protein EBS01_00015 [Verrucomicrobia bacterium]|nr:hypothetical protein [Verrucomicrobiota bacterium]